jgi:hypothetical protein
VPPHLLEPYRPFETLSDALQPKAIEQIRAKAEQGLGSVDEHLGQVVGKLEGYGVQLAGLAPE